MKNQKKKQLTFTKDKKEFNSIIKCLNVRKENYLYW